MQPILPGCKGQPKDWARWSAACAATCCGRFRSTLLRPPSSPAPDQQRELPNPTLVVSPGDTNHCHTYFAVVPYGISFRSRPTIIGLRVVAFLPPPCAGGDI